MFATIKKGGREMTLLLAVAAALLMLVLPRAAQGQQAPIDLWAASGTVTMPGGQSVDVWGFTDQDPTSGGTAGLPGPVIELDEGQEVSLTLHNTLDRNVSFMSAGLAMAPDTTGVAPGASKTYTFTPERPGTFLYESGVDPQQQVQMGLYGALVVHPATAGQAYDDASSAYDSEEVLVLSEVDPAFHANPDTANPSQYASKYSLINGKAYPETDPIVASAGQKVLLRLVNAGYEDHTMQMLGMQGETIASDGNLLNDPQPAFSQTLAPGETYDLISQVPNAAPGTRFPLYSADMSLSNGGADAQGGMTTFVEAQ